MKYEDYDLDLLSSRHFRISERDRFLTLSAHYKCANVEQSRVVKEKDNEMVTIYAAEQAYNKTTLENLEKSLVTKSGFKYDIGMCVWNKEGKTVRYSHNLADVIDRPCLSDFATVGHVIQQAWRIAESEKNIAIVSIRNRPLEQIMMGNVDPPRAVVLFANAMQQFCLNGLTSMPGLMHLVEVFSCTSEACEHRGT